MAEEAVIFPSQPLFMVDRSWQRRSNKVSSSTDSGHSSRVPEITITVLNGTDHARGEKSRSTKANPASKRKPTKKLSVKFLNYHPQETNRRKVQYKDQDPRGDGNGKHDLEKQPKPKKPVVAGKDASPARVPDSLLILSKPIPRSTSPVYNLIDPEVSEFERFLAYYPTRLADAIYPMRHHLRFEYNTLAEIWLPVAITDELLLHAILFSSALHLYGMTNNDGFKDAGLLMKVVFDRLNRRIRNATLSDATIGAVSCLAMCENTLGKHGRFAMHMSGMAEMVRVRGGMSAIQRELQMKIFRADIVGAVDTLSQPRLNSPDRTPGSLYETLGLQTACRSPLQVMLDNSGLTSKVVHLLERLSQLSLAIEQAMETQVLINPLLFEEEVLCLQYDFLTALDLSRQNLDNAFCLAALIYLQSITRPAPYNRTSSRALSLDLEVSLLNLDVASLPTPLLFWLLVMGGFVSNETSEKSWFRRRLHECQVSWKKTISWESMKVQLMTVIWIDKIHNEYGKALWEEVIHLGCLPDI